jgi:putative toxin-antitoxin system antitoxin component (TIGR02293 family)
VDTETETAKMLGISVPRGKLRSALWISHAVTHGLPLSALERLVHQVAPNDKDFIYNFVSKPTLARRRKAYLDLRQAKGSRGKANYTIALEAAKKNYRRLTDDAKQALRKQKYRDLEKQKYRGLETSRSHIAVLSPTEGAKVARLAEVWAMARRVWGSDSDARAFLFRPHPLLDNIRPIDVVLESELGRPLVEQVLGRLQYGSAA